MCWHRKYESKRLYFPGDYVGQHNLLSRMDEDATANTEVSTYILPLPNLGEEGNFLYSSMAVEGKRIHAVWLPVQLMIVEFPL